MDKRYLCRILTPLCLLVLVLSMVACSHEEPYMGTSSENFDALWKIIDEHYCYLDEKGIDWEETGRKYREMIQPEMTQPEFFDLLASMLDELQDGHVNLISPFNTSSYKGWWLPYPTDFSYRTLRQYYLDYDYYTTSGMIYKILPSGAAYIYIPSFSNQIGDTSLDWVLALLSECPVLILDIRDNGGGLLTDIDTLVGRFITEEITGGYIRHKTGPGHNDFSDPYPIVYKPAVRGRIMWDKPILLLTNRSCFSAANDFTSVMKELPQVTVIGARTGGGGGMPFTSSLPCGWAVRFSACPITDARGISIESGIEPDIEVHCTDAGLASGIDAILDAAISYASSLASDAGSLKSEKFTEP